MSNEEVARMLRKVAKYAREPTPNVPAIKALLLWLDDSYDTTYQDPIRQVKQWVKAGNFETVATWAESEADDWSD
jgi:hypothetical protein